MVTRFTVVIISQYIKKLNYYVVHLKLTYCYMRIIPQFLKIYIKNKLLEYFDKLFFFFLTT